MRALLTGSGGFIGAALVKRFDDISVLRMGAPDWRARLERMDFSGRVVFHLAARVHQANADPAAWMRDNVEKTQILARAAARGGARRFVFMSTLKVHGEETGAAPFRPADPFDPRDGYARSKALAEERLAAIARETSLEVVALRPPLVFGREAKANLRALVRLADGPLPLPFASIDNRRSWVHVDDLCDLAVMCAEHPSAVSRAFLAAHPRPFSTTALVAGLRERLGRPGRMFTLPKALIEAAGAVAGRRMSVMALTRSLEADPSDAIALGWRPRIAFDAALDDLVAGWRA